MKNACIARYKPIRKKNIPRRMFLTPDILTWYFSLLNRPYQAVYFQLFGPLYQYLNSRTIHDRGSR